jgi:predicted homoserine dehydrogenase-like protein
VIIIDSALRAREAEGRPIRVGMIGAGFMARGIANQIINSAVGMRLVAIYARRIDQAVQAYEYATPGVTPVIATNQSSLETAIAAGRPVVTDDPMLVCRADGVDVVIDVTGAVELGAQVALEAFRCGRHVVLMNAEVDATLGPILKVRARNSGVVLSACDGDQPAVQINLFRFVKGMGLIPRVLGNIKGLQDPYRTPITQQSFAEKWGQKPQMVTSFADGSKVSCEQAIVANATGMTVGKRGMFGFQHDDHVDALTKRYDLDRLRELGGIVDYVVGARPAPGVYCLAEHPDPRHQHYLNLYKLGEGPLYSFYTPYHLCHFETPNTIARVALFGDSAGAPLDAPRVEVCAVAKRELAAGEVLDDYGCFMHYGEAVSAAERRARRYLPQGLAEGCRLLRTIARDQVITYDDVMVPPGRLSDQLYAEQNEYFSESPALVSS